MEPTSRQLSYLRALAERTGQTFTMPRSGAQASDEIRRLRAQPRSPDSERALERSDVQRALAERPDDATAIRISEVTGYGSTAAWSARVADAAFSRVPMASRPRTQARTRTRSAERPSLAAAEPARNVWIAGRYAVSAGERVLIAEVRGQGVTLSDHPAARAPGARYPVAASLAPRGVAALVEQYIAEARERDVVPMTTLALSHYLPPERRAALEMTAVEAAREREARLAAERSLARRAFDGELTRRRERGRAIQVPVRDGRLVLGERSRDLGIEGPAL